MTMTSTEIVQYLHNITPDESDVPDYYIDKLKNSSNEFILKKLKISDILKKDKSLKAYVMSGEDRYGKDKEDGDHIHIKMMCFRQSLFSTTKLSMGIQELLHCIAQEITLSRPGLISKKRIA